MRLLGNWASGKQTGWGMIEDYDYLPHVQLICDLRPPRKKRYRPRR